MLDGDSIRVVRRNEQIDVRLEGIDAPEHHQDFADRSKQELSDLVYGKEVEVARVTTDNYGRLVSRVYIDQLNVNLEMVRRGLAWHYKRYSTDSALAAAETTARARRAGLWVDPAPVPPWSYRRSGAQSGSPAAAAQPRQPQTQTHPSAGGASDEVHGNTSSHVFHTASCPNYRCRNCTAIFAGATAAEAAGFKPAGCCHPATR